MPPTQVRLNWRQGQSPGEPHVIKQGRMVEAKSFELMLERFKRQRISNRQCNG